MCCSLTHPFSISSAVCSTRGTSPGNRLTKCADTKTLPLLKCVSIVSIADTHQSMILGIISNVKLLGQVFMFVSQCTEIEVNKILARNAGVGHLQSYMPSSSSCSKAQLQNGKHHLSGAERRSGMIQVSKHSKRAKSVSPIGSAIASKGEKLVLMACKIFALGTDFILVNASETRASLFSPMLWLAVQNNTGLSNCVSITVA